MGGHSGIWRVNSHFPFVTWQVWCTVMAALLHYFLLCVFTWMFNHGVLLYLLIIKADLRDNIHSKMKWFYTFGWGKRKVNVNLRHHTLFHRGSTQSYWISAVRCKWRRENWKMEPATSLKKASLSYCGKNTGYHIVYVLRLYCWFSVS